MTDRWEFWVWTAFVAAWYFGCGYVLGRREEKYKQ